MPAASPFEDLFDQLRKLLTFVDEHMHVPPEQMTIPPDIDKRLKRLKKRVDAFKELSDQIVGLSGVSDEELKMRLKGVSKELPPDGKELLNIGHSLKGQALELKDQFEAKLKYAQIAPETEEAEIDPKEPPKRDLTDKEKAKKRSSKFKRFGSNEKWKPL